MANANDITWLLTVSAFSLLLWFFPGVEGACTKFSSKTPKVAAEVNGICYYGFDTTYQWNEAVNLCLGEGTQLVLLQTTAKQNAVFQALGGSFGQHWVGLKFVLGFWMWYYSDTTLVDASSDVSGRWEGGYSTGKVAYTMTSNNILLKPTDLTSWYRPVCEDGASTSAATTTAVPFSLPGASLYGMFEKQTSLPTSSALYSSTSSVYRMGCALHCVAMSGCKHFVFAQRTGGCAIHDATSGAVFSPSCSGDYSCFTRI